MPADEIRLTTDLDEALRRVMRRATDVADARREFATPPAGTTTADLARAVHLAQRDLDEAIVGYHATLLEHIAAEVRRTLADLAALTSRGDQGAHAA